MMFIGGLICGIILAILVFFIIAKMIDDNLEDMHYGREPRHGGIIKEASDNHVSNWKE